MNKAIVRPWHFSDMPRQPDDVPIRRLRSEADVALTRHLGPPRLARVRKTRRWLRGAMSHVAVLRSGAFGAHWCPLLYGGCRPGRQSCSEAFER